MIRLLLLLSVVISISSCIDVPKPYNQLPPGAWHSELTLADGVILPFNMETSYDEDGTLQVNVINGAERIEVGDVLFGRDQKLRDTVRLDFPLMDSHLSAIYKENVMEGVWTVRNREDYQIPFVAYHGQDFRFSHRADEAIMDVSGRWAVTFGVETDGTYPAIGEFEQSGNDVTGTFMTETGDYRYLAGEIQGDQLMLSVFDGSHAFLFTATVSQEATMIGKFYSGNHYQTSWVASKDDDATLTSAYNLTAVKNAGDKLSISMPNTEGKIISLDDAPYAGKPKLISVMGTWCPNCLDESKFIKQYLADHPDLDVEVLAIAFERYKDKDKAIAMISKYKDRLGVPYEMLYGGYYSKSVATEELGIVDEIISYPTLLFVRPDNTVSGIYTGFSGPATSEFENFKITFEKELSKITQ